jgi:hypothetical protein
MTPVLPPNHEPKLTKVRQIPGHGALSELQDHHQFGYPTFPLAKFNADGEAGLVAQRPKEPRSAMQVRPLGHHGRHVPMMSL